jgi:hypothetical protein
VPIQALKALNQAVKTLNQPDKILIPKANNRNQRLKTMIQALKKLNQLLKKAIQRLPAAKNCPEKASANLKFNCNRNGLRNPFESPIPPRRNRPAAPQIAPGYRLRNTASNAALSCLPPPLRWC